VNIAFEEKLIVNYFELFLINVWLYKLKRVAKQSPRFPRKWNSLVAFRSSQLNSLLQVILARRAMSTEQLINSDLTVKCLAKRVLSQRVHPASVRSCRNSLRKITVTRTLFREWVLSRDLVQRRSINLVSDPPLALYRARRALLRKRSVRETNSRDRHSRIVSEQTEQSSDPSRCWSVLRSAECSDHAKFTRSAVRIRQLPFAGSIFQSHDVARKERTLPTIYRSPRELNPTFLGHPVALSQIGRCPPMHPVVYPADVASLQHPRVP